MRERLTAGLQQLRVGFGAVRSFFGGRLPRLEFVGRIALYLGLMVLLFWPATTFLSTSSKTIRDLYYLLALLTAALCLFGMVKAYIERLRDAGLSLWWTPVFLIVPGAAAGWLGQLYVHHRIEDRSFASEPIMSAIFSITFAAPLILALWRGSVPVAADMGAQSAESGRHRNAVELAATGLALLIVIPASIYAGLFQEGVWVGRTYASVPLADSGRRHKFLKCWNLKGVGAGSGDGVLSGIYRDGFESQVVDFFRGEDDGFDLAFVGGSDGRSFREQGFNVAARGIVRTDEYDLPDRFMISADYDDGSAEATVNHVNFAIARTGRSFGDYHVVMTTTQILPQMTGLADFPKARGKVMIGDCMRSF